MRTSISCPLANATPSRYRSYMENTNALPVHSELEWAKSQLEHCSSQTLEWISLGFSETAAVEAKWAARYAHQYIRLIEASK